MNEVNEITLTFSDVRYDDFEPMVRSISIDDHIVTEHLISDEILSIFSGDESSSCVLEEGYAFQYVRELSDILSGSVFKDYVVESIHFSHLNMLIVNLRK